MLPWSGCQQIKCWKLLAVVRFKDRNPMKSDETVYTTKSSSVSPEWFCAIFSGLGTCMGFARSQRRTIASWFRPELECISSAIPTRVIWFYWASSLLEYLESGTVCLECRIGIFFHALSTRIKSIWHYQLSWPYATLQILKVTPVSSSPSCNTRNVSIARCWICQDLVSTTVHISDFQWKRPWRASVLAAQDGRIQPVLETPYLAIPGHTSSGCWMESGCKVEYPTRATWMDLPGVVLQPIAQEQSSCVIGRMV